jgi:hypothetical protein
MIGGLLVGLLVLIVALLAILNGLSAARRTAEMERETALRDLETQRKISDATRNPVSVDAARGWLRDFGGAKTPDKR